MDKIIGFMTQTHIIFTICLQYLKGGLNEKFQKRKPSRRTNGGFVNDVLSSWEEMKIEHIRNAIDTQKEVMLEIIEKQGGSTTFLSSNAASKL